MVTIMSKPMPRWYGLSWDAKAGAIRVRLHKDTPLPREAWDRIRQEFVAVRGIRWSPLRNFLMFNTDFSRGWFGFDEVFNVVEHPEHFEFVGKVPRVRMISRWPCYSCKGLTAGRCLDCKGTGKSFYDNSRRADALSISIGALLNPIEYNEVEVSSQEPQLLTTHFMMSDHDVGMGGMVSSAFHRWARHYPRYTQLGDVEEAMGAAHAHMMGKSSELTIAWFSAKIYSDKHHFSLDQSFRGGVWGGPDDNPGENRGYEFHSKDLYSSVDQLVFLAGLAALHDRADREIKKQQKTA